MAETRQRLIDGAIETIRSHGILGTSAGVSQALVFYHFGSVHELLRSACVAATHARVAPFLDQLDQVTDLRELLALGRSLHAQERTLGNVAVLAQMLAGAQGRPRTRGGDRGGTRPVGRADRAHDRAAAHRLAAGGGGRHRRARPCGVRRVHRAGAVRGHRPRGRGARRLGPARCADGGRRRPGPGGPAGAAGEAAPLGRVAALWANPAAWTPGVDLASPVCKPHPGAFPHRPGLPVARRR